MAKVVATEKGFYGSAIRLPGDVFEAEGTASWFKPVKGKERQSAEEAHKADAADAKAEAKENEQVDPLEKDGFDQDDGDQDDGHSHGDGLQAMTVKALRAHAKNHGIAIPADAATKADIIAVIEAGEKANAPVRVTNEVAELTGSVQPDWVQG